MADIGDRNVNTAFTGLLTTVAIFGGVSSICLVGFEVFRQFRRLPNVHFTRFWRPADRDVGGGIDGQDQNKDDEENTAVGTAWKGLGTRDRKDGGKGKLTCEDWEMGHLYLARMFHATTPSPPLARWPLAWAWQAIKFDDWFYATHTGMDTVVYVRFLRALVWYLTLHTLTTAPLLLGINLRFSTGADYKDMSAASISFLVTIPDAGCADPNSADCKRTPNEEGRSLLWIHLIAMYWVSITWFVALLWIARGSISIRSRLIEETRKKRKERKRKEQEERDRNYDENENGSGPQVEGLDVNAEMINQHGLGGQNGKSNFSTSAPPEDDDEGWRQRTLMVLNLPTTMRDEASIRRYFEEFLRPDDEDSVLDLQITQSQNSKNYQQDGQKGENNLSVAQDPKCHSRKSNLSEDSNISAMGEDTGMMDASGVHEGATHLDRQKSLVRSDRGLLRPDSPDDDPNSSSTGIEPSSGGAGPVGPEPDTNPDRHLRSPVQTVVLVRKMNELSAMLTRRQEVLAQLEAAHIKLAKNVMSSVGKRTNKMRHKKREEGKGGMGGVGGGELDNKDLKREHKAAAQGEGSDETKAATSGSDGVRNDVEKEATEKTRKQLEQEALEDLTRRLARFSPNNKGRHGREAQMRGDEEEDEANVMAETVWESLATVPRELLDPYQPATRLSALFRGQTVPTIDYLLTKLNLLTALVTEMRARPPSSYEPTSTAFVTFRDPRQARMVWRELKSQIVVRVRLAPEVKDLDWERLMRTSFTGDLARGLGVNAFFWGLTIFWVIPIQLLTSVLFSVKNLRLVFPPVETFFESHPGVEAFVSVTLPTVLVSLITMAVPEIIFQISKRAQGFVTFSALYDQCLCRYWKFIICNVVIFFCIGVTTIETILQQVVLSGDLLLTIAFSFPAAAPFYVSYLILGISLHSGFELFGFMVPLIQHLGARKAFTPRARALKTLPRNFNRYYWLPFHILIVTIVFIFAILNPLILPFALVYLFVAMVVFKKNLAYVYFRRFNEKDGVVYFTRLLRFSLDGLLVGQIVIVVFFAVTNQRAVYIGMSALLTPFTVGCKLFGSRLWASQSRALDDSEANALCGITVNYASNGEGEDTAYGSRISTASKADGSPLDARARGRYPTVLPPPSTGSAFYRAWQKVHDSFNANGADRPSYVATAQARGQQLANPVQQGARTLASVPLDAVRQKAGNASHFRNALTLHFGKNKDYEERAESVASKREVQVQEAIVASQNLPEAAAAGDQEFKEEKKAIDPEGTPRGKTQRRRPSRRGSSRSENRPFLSGADAVMMNAPVEHDAGDLGFNYGDEDGYEARMARTPSGTPRRNSRRGSQLYRSPSRFRGEGPGSGFLSDEKGRRLSEFGHLIPAHESEEGKESGEAAKDISFEEDDDEEEEEEEDAHRDLVCPHANVRWDDTPSNSARYNNPFYNTELDPFLWLPRDPLALLDLYDTIEWHGAALVSSQGGQGYVGDWDEEEEEEYELREKGHYDDDSDDGLDGIEGHEQILLTGTLARHLEEVEDVEDVPDPAASLSKAVLADYKKAIRRGSNVGSQDDSSTLGPNALVRQGSMMSHASFRSPTLSARMRVDGDYLDRPPSPIDLRSSPTNALRPVSSAGADQERLRRFPTTKRKDTAGTIPSFDLNTSDPVPASPLPDAAVASPTAASEDHKQRAHFEDASVAGHDHKASTAGPHRPSTLLPLPTEQRIFSSPAGVSFQTPAQVPGDRLERQGTTGSHFRYGTGASGMSGASLKSGATSVGRNRTITMKKALQAEVLEEERRLLLREKLGTIKRKTTMLRGTTHKVEAQQSENLQRGDTIMSRHERALQRRRDAKSEAESVYEPEQQSPTHPRVASAESQTPRNSRFLLRDMSFSRTPKTGTGAGNVDGSHLQMQELSAQGVANNARSQLNTPTPSTSKRPPTLFLGDQQNYQYTDFGIQSSPGSYKTGGTPSNANNGGDLSRQQQQKPAVSSSTSEKKSPP